MNLYNVKNFFEEKIILISTIVFILIWYFILGVHFINEPYIWDDLHFFRKYNNEELINIWIGNWDSDGIETQAYRPLAVLYYHFLYLLFEENTFLLRHVVIIEALILILISNKLLIYLEFTKTSVIFFTIIIIFSKIFVTLISWFTISVLILSYILTILSILFYLKSIDYKKNIYYYLSLFLVLIGLLIREELYAIPLCLFLIFFYKNQVNMKNIFYSVIRTAPFFLLILIHIFLKKKFIPEAEHFQLVDHTIKFGGSFLDFAGYIKALKSSFLPMGYLSSSYSNLTQSLFSWIWLSTIILSILFIIKKIDFNLKNNKKNLIVFLLIFIFALPHLAIPRAFGIYLSSFFGLILISILFNNLFLVYKKSKSKDKFLSIVLMSILLITGFSGGIYRSFQHIETVNEYSVHIITYDAVFIYAYENDNIVISIPKDRYLSKKKHLKNLGINDFNHGEKLNINHEKVKKTRIHPLYF